MTPVSPVKVDVDVNADHSCNNWKCCYGCKCWKKLNPEIKKESPVSMEIVERVTRSYERHHHSHKSSPLIVPYVSSPPPLLKIGNTELSAHLRSASQASFIQNNEHKNQDERKD